MVGRNRNMTDDANIINERKDAIIIELRVLRLASSVFLYEGWNFNFGNTPLDWIQELLE